MESLMPSLFPEVLLSCVGEGRSPEPREVAVMTETIWREAYGINSPSDSCQRAGLFAWAALNGQGEELWIEKAEVPAGMELDVSYPCSQSRLKPQFSHL